ncbi:amino acid ABC transporter permease [Herbiconiux sp. L3-i23]|uniref:amino acid ABC transporter permease n=1 Tax=Herbiconiux sp. L3-i23 TaxID=2905871 RepID=UPI00207048E5|nr:amino acid ABC transporter permease [Herbiconiux sp. L3-i23]BDI22240.1 glutamate ABC transporter permease [Herbiconiux sp. L3-i23]
MSSVLYDAPGPRTRRTSRVISTVIGAILIVAVGYVLLTLGGQGLFDYERWDIFNDPLVWLDLLGALGTTLRLALISSVLAILLGMVISLLRMADHSAIRIPTTIVLEFLRGLPVLLMMVFFWAVLGLDQEIAVIIALSLYNGAIIGEALRSGLVALPRGQRESGLAIGLGSLQTRLAIEFPQAFRNMLPIIVAQLVVLLKDTSLAYVLGGVIELIRRGRLTAEFFGASQYSFSIFVVVGAMYLAVNLTVSAIARRLAKRRGYREDPVTANTDQSLQAPSI